MIHSRCSKIVKNSKRT